VLPIKPLAPVISTFFLIICFILTIAKIAIT
jgi:hypothetical protein